jgi:hypothetical protein
LENADFLKAEFSKEQIRNLEINSRRGNSPAQLGIAKKSDPSLFLLLNYRRLPKRKKLLGADCRSGSAQCNGSGPTLG